MIEDFDVFQSIFKKANAGLYKYRSTTQIDSVFAVNKGKIAERLSYSDFFSLLWNVIDFTGSCHNELHYPDSLDSVLNKEKIFFPLPLKYLAARLYTNYSDKNIPVGSRIISINGISTDSFTKQVSHYSSTDGFNTTGKKAFINSDWLAFYIYLAFGAQDNFSIEFEYNKEIKTIQIPSVPYKKFISNFKNRHSKIFEESLNPDDYSYQFIDSIHTGILTVRTFAMGGPTTNGHRQYAKFLDSVFINLKQKSILNLIVDIRGNGGGDDPNDLLLYSYLTQRDFRENTSAFTLFNTVPFQNYYIDDDLVELEKDLKKEHTIFRNGKYYQNSSFNKVWKPNKNAFKGTLVLLVDPYVASAASLFASMVKSDENTMVIGEETLGGYYGHTGHLAVNYQLPNSKLILTFSIVDLEQDVRKLPDEKYGYGVIPDFTVIQSHKDFLDSKDRQMSYAIELLKTLPN